MKDNQEIEDCLKSLSPEFRMIRAMIPAKWKRGVDMGLSIITSINELNEDEQNALLQALHKALGEVAPTFSEKSLSNPKVINSLRVLDALLTETGKKGDGK